MGSNFSRPHCHSQVVHGLAACPSIGGVKIAGTAAPSIRVDPARASRRRLHCPHNQQGRVMAPQGVPALGSFSLAYFTPLDANLRRKGIV